MRNKIHECMDDLMQNNCVCNYIIASNRNEIYIENVRALDAYMMAIEMSKSGNVECYMAASGKENKAAKPVFTVIDGVVKLSNCVIK